LDIKILPPEWIPVVVLSAIFLALTLIERLSNFKPSIEKSSSPPDNGRVITLILDRINALERSVYSEFNEIKSEIKEIKNQLNCIQKERFRNQDQ